MFYKSIVAMGELVLLLLLSLAAFVKDWHQYGTPFLKPSEVLLNPSTPAFRFCDATADTGHSWHLAVDGAWCAE